MKKSNKIVMLITLLLSFTINMSFAQQIKNMKTETVKVSGNCGTCKQNIETAAFQKKISSAVWDSYNKTAVLTYDSTKTTADAILKNIALAGYDNQNYMAPDNAFNSLDMCCQYDRKKSSQQLNQPGGDANMNMNHDMTSMNTKDTVVKQDTVKNVNPLTNVYTVYFSLKDALTKDDGTTAATKAKELSDAIAKVPMEKFPTEQHMVWMKYMSQLSADADKIKSTTDVSIQRESFATLSTNMHEVMAVIKPDYTVYYDYCPMKKAYWLSQETGIANPFYGSQMLTCGSTKETITK